MDQKYNRKSNNFHKNKKKNFRNDNDIKNNMYNNGKVDQNINKFHNGENKRQVDRSFVKNAPLQDQYNRSGTERHFNPQQQNANVQISNSKIENNGKFSTENNLRLENKNFKESLNRSENLVNNNENCKVIENNRDIQNRTTTPANKVSSENNSTMPIDQSVCNVKQNNQIDVIDSLNKHSESVSSEEKNIDAKDLITHPLCCSWTFWHTTIGNSYQENLFEVKTFDTVEDFWSLVNFLKPPTHMHFGTVFSLFKQGIRPMWEDPRNKNGGSVSLTIKNEYDMDLTNGLWLDTILSLIDGQTYGSSFDIIHGALFNIRAKFQRIELWVSNREEKKKIDDILKRFEAYLRNGNHFDNRMIINFKNHQ